MILMNFPSIMATILVVDQNQIGVQPTVSYLSGFALSLFLIFGWFSSSASPLLLQLALPLAMALVSWVFLFRFRVLINLADRVHALRLVFCEIKVWQSHWDPVGDKATITVRSVRHVGGGGAAPSSWMFHDIVLKCGEDELLVARKRTYNKERPAGLVALATDISRSLDCDLLYDRQ